MGPVSSADIPSRQSVPREKGPLGPWQPWQKQAAHENSRPHIQPHIQPQLSGQSCAESTSQLLVVLSTAWGSQRPRCLLFKAEGLLRGFWEARPRLLGSHNFFFLITVNEENIVTGKSHGEGSYSFRNLQQQKHLRLKFRMLSSQINDHLFPKVTAETILVQSKSFRKQGKHITKCPKCEQTGGGTEHSRSSLEKILTLLLFRGITKTGPKGSH